MNEEEDYLKQVEKTGGTVFSSVMPVGDGSPIDLVPGGGGGGGQWGRRLLGLCRSGDASGVARLAGLGAPLAADWLGAGPLHLAARAGHAAVGRALLRAGANKDARTKLARTPLHLAAYHRHLEVLDVLLEFGASVDPTDMLGMTPLHWAAEVGWGAGAQALLRAGAQPHLPNKFLKSPLHLAARKPELHRLMMDLIAERESQAATTAFEVEEEQEPQIEGIPIHLKTEDPEKKDNTCKIEAGSGAAVLRAHGITLLAADSADSGGTAASALRAGRSVVLSDAGRLMLSESAEATRSSQPIKVVQIKKDIKITGIKRPAAAMENTIEISATASSPTSQKVTYPTGEFTEVSDIDDVTDGKSPAVKIIMNRANFNKLVATANRIHSPEKQVGVGVGVGVGGGVGVGAGWGGGGGGGGGGGQRALQVPASFVRSSDPRYLRSQLLCAHAALAAARRELRARGRGLDSDSEHNTRGGQR